MRWIWLRHGQTEANEQGRYLGHTESPFTDRGKAHIEQAVEALNGLQASRLYTSDLGRCQAMASAIGDKLQLTPIVEPALRELHFGQWEGLTYDEIVERDRSLVFRWYDAPLHERPPGGETLVELGQRFDPWLEKALLAAAPEDTIVVVTHGGPLRWLLSRYVHADVSGFWQREGVKHGGMLALDYAEGKWALVSNNEGEVKPV